MNELRALVQVSLRYRYVVAFGAFLVLVLGVLQVQRMPIDVFPEFAPPQVEIQTPALGLSAEEVEQLITAPLEESFAGLPNLETMRSKSVEQLSSIKLIFERGTDLMEARQAIQERLSLVVPTLPTWAAPPNMMPPLSSTARTVKIGIRSDTLSIVDLSMITYWTIRERLLRVPGVANVAIWGERIDIPTCRSTRRAAGEHNVTVDRGDAGHRPTRSTRAWSSIRRIGRRYRWLSRHRRPRLPIHYESRRQRCRHARPGAAQRPHRRRRRTARA